MSREVAIVTGGARGLGAAYVEGLKGAGFDVVVADLSESDAGDLYVRVDVSDPASTEAMAEAVVERFGRIDVLINNAGVLHADRQEAVRGADGRGVGSRVRGQRPRHVALLPRGGADDEGTALGQDRQHLVDDRPERHPPASSTTSRPSRRSSGSPVRWRASSASGGSR